MKRTWEIRAVAAALALASLARAAPAVPDEALLLSAYHQYGFAQAVGEQCAGLAEGLAPAQAGEVKSVASDWVSLQMDGIRSALESRFGDAARDRFEQFVTRFSAALRDEDAEALDAVARAISPAGRTAEVLLDFKREALKKSQANAADLLGEIQTWADLARRGADVPPLEGWLLRAESPPKPAAPPTPPPRRRNPLAEAEAAPVEYAGDAGAENEGNALESFAAMRRSRRERALADAQAGMQQIAQERQAAEQEYAARKTAAAQADAEAVKAHAQKLAAAETEALEQRKNSWSSRLKNIVSSTVGAAVGAFTGGVGTEAGQRAAQEIFR